MRLVQQPKEETPSLPLWLSRDVPHERAFANELLSQMGREQSLDYLLRLHDLEETKHQTRLRVYLSVCFSFLAAMLFCMLAIQYAMAAFPPAVALIWMRVFLPMEIICSLGVFAWTFTVFFGKNRKTAFRSSPVQQNLITALLDYPDSPLLAEPLSRALVYYVGDRDLLYKRLARVLPLLPSDPDALTRYARAALERRLSPTTYYAHKGEKERAPALKAAIRKYFARTGKPAWRPIRNWFKKETQ